MLAQFVHGIDPNTFETTVEDKYFYIKDRLGSVRLMITGIADEADTDWADVVNSYTYDPYGNDFYDGNAGVLAQLVHGVNPNTFETTVEDKYFYRSEKGSGFFFR